MNPLSLANSANFKTESIDLQFGTRKPENGLKFQKLKIPNLDPRIACSDNRFKPKNKEAKLQDYRSKKY